MTCTNQRLLLSQYRRALRFVRPYAGRLVLITRRTGLLDLDHRFDIRWFVSAIYKYRHLLSEVLLASFFLQVFALVSPLFFQVVIDKVLVHRSFTTLEVLVIGLLAGAVCYTAVALKPFFKYDDTLDAFGVHGIGGFLGALLTGVLASAALWGNANGYTTADGIALGREIGRASCRERVLRLV